MKTNLEELDCRKISGISNFIKTYLAGFIARQEPLEEFPSRKEMRNYALTLFDSEKYVDAALDLLNDSGLYTEIYVSSGGVERKVMYLSKTNLKS